MLNELSSAKYALSVLVLALVIVLYLFANSAFFDVEKIEWTGLTYLSSEQLNVYLDLPSSNVWRLDTNSLVVDLLDHPWVEDAQATWRWPNRLIVQVEERFPIAQTVTEAGWILLDRDGQLLPPTQGNVAYSLPIVTNLDWESQEQRMATARLIDMIPETLIGSVSEWNALQRSFVTRAGVEILMGEPVELEEKFVLLEGILADLDQRNEQAKRIDLRVPHSPVVSLL